MYLLEFVYISSTIIQHWTPVTNKSHDAGFLKAGPWVLDCGTPIAET